MNKIVLSFLSALFFSASSFAGERYWVGGSGNWSDAAHWSGTSGGKGGVAIPTIEDNVYFDENSFSNKKQIVAVNFSIEFFDISIDTFVDWKFLSVLPGLSFVTHNGEHTKTVLQNAIHFNIQETTGKKDEEVKPVSAYNYDFGKNLSSTEKSIENSSPLSHTCTVVITSPNLCPNDCIATAIVNVTPAAGSYTYSWSTSPVQTTQTATGLCAGAGYSVLVGVTGSPADNCLQVFTLPNIAPFGNFFINTPPLCFGDCNGSSTITVAGGTPPYSYSWNTVPVQAASTATGLCAGTYIVTVTDFNGCTTTATTIVTQPAAINPNPTQTNVACNTSCTGAASVAPTGGSPCPGYTYLWAPGGQTTSGTAGLCAGGYTVTITDCNGCTATQSFNITQPLLLSASITTTNNPLSCFGDCNASATVTPGGGVGPYTYSWNTAPAQATATATGLCAGNYTVTVTDANLCTATATVSITQPPDLTIPPIATTNNPLSCSGDCNATATAAPVGGSPGYTYSWNTVPAQPTASATGLCAGSYTVTVTDMKGCTETAVVTITEPPPLTATITAKTDVNCNGICIGSATVTGMGGVPGPGYTYSWAPVGQTTKTATGLCAGTYTVTVTDANLCTATAVVTITTPSPLLITPSQTNLTCNAVCNGAASVAPVSGGTPPYTYLWAPGGQTTPNRGSLCAGGYTVTVTDFNGCTITQSFNITQPSALTLTPSQTNLVCNGICTGVAGVSPGGGVAPYTYSWAPGAETTPTITGQCAGAYTVTITDANLCTRTATVTITQPPPLTVSTINVNPLCNGNCNGSITAAPAGGTPGPGYSYLWNPGAFTTASITGLCLGSYTLEVTDANGCTVQTTVTLTDPLVLAANASAMDAVCGGTCDGQVTASPTGGTTPYSYLWIPGGFTTPTVTGRCAGTYTVTVTDANGCTSTGSVTVAAPSPLAVTITAVTTACSICNGTATANASGGVGLYSYSWFPSGQTTQTATGLCVGFYTVTVTDASGCSATAVALVNFTVLINIVPSATNVSCNGVCDGTATANASGGTPPYSYLWNPSGQTMNTATGLCAGTIFTVTVTDQVGCFNSATITFTQPPVLTASITSSTNASCIGQCNGTATAAGGGGTSPYSYSWNTFPAQTTLTATGLCAGIYTVTVTDTNFCTATQTVTITEPPPILANPSVTNAACGVCDGIISLAPSGGNGGPYTYLWAPGGQTTSSIAALCAGAYNVTITDVAGCTVDVPIAVSNTSAPTVTISQTNKTCNTLPCDGSATASVAGGTPPYAYTWSPAVGTLGSATGLCAGSYTLTISDAQIPACSTIVIINITEPPPILPNATVINESCGGSCDGSITLAPSGGTPVPCGYTYLWAPGGQTTSTLNNLCAGGYTVTITDCNGCTIQPSFTVAGVPPLAVVMASTNVTCNGLCNGTAYGTASGGTPPYSYLWSTAPPQPQDTAVNLCPANYTLTVTDANGCTITGTVNITEPPVFSSSITAFANVTCFGACNGTATATATGGTSPYSYTWNPGVQIDPIAVALCAGSYTVTVFDQNGCTTTSSIVITEPPQLLPNVTTTNVTCNAACNGSATSTPLGGTPPYTYFWSPGGQISNSIAGLCDGSYTVVVTDSAGCTQNQVVVITEPATLLVGVTAIIPSCVGNCDGTLTATPSGGTLPYVSYSWSASGGQTTPTATGLCAGTYTITVTDTNGCTGTSVFVLNDPVPITSTTVVADANCGFIPCDGTATATPAGGTPPYFYSWNPGGQTTAAATALCAGFYTLTITDTQGCTAQFTVGVSNTTAPILTFFNTDPLCNGFCTGTDSVGVVGTLPFTYLWNPPVGQTTPSISGLCAGVYQVMVTDGIGCISIDPDTIIEPVAIADGAVVVNATCNGICNGSITTTVTGGTAPYVYLWSPGGAVTTSITGLCPGTYTLNITDANSCTFSNTYTINQNTIVSGSISGVVNATCASSCNGSAFVSGSGGNPPYTYLWSDPLGQATQTATGLCAGTYTATVTDAIGCFGTLTVTITAPPAITVPPTIVDATCGQCNGQISVTPAGGTSPYTFVWSNGSTTSSATGLCAGVYQLNISDVAGCAQSFTFAVNNTNAPTGVVVTTPASCFGTCDGTANVTPSGGTAPYTYFWVPGGQTTPSLAGMCAGNYICQIIDAYGCVGNVPVTIASPAQILSNQTVVNTLCGLCNGSITLNPSGGTAPYTYAWLPGGEITAGISTLCAGNYSVTITDANSCTQQYIIPISSSNGPVVSVTTIGTSCNGGTCDGTATTAVSGGTPPYNYLWSDPGVQTTPIATGLCAGNYVLTVTDAVAGCVVNVNVTITTPSAISLGSPVSINPRCNNDCNGIAGVTPVGGTLPYTFVWSTVPVQTTSIISNLCSGTYTVDITDANGCTAQQIITLINPPLLTTTGVVTDATCNTIPDGAIDITVSGGTGTYTYLWTPGGTTTQDVTTIFSGTHTVVVTDINNCTNTTSFTVNSLLTVIAVAGNDTAICFGDTATLCGTLSTGGTTYLWQEIPAMTNVGTTTCVQVSPPLTASYILITANGLCADTDTVVVTVNPLPLANAGSDATIVIFTSTPIGASPTGGLSYNWTPGTGLTDSTIANPIASPTVTATYTLSVTNTGGCTSIDSVTVTVLPEIVFPDGVSPNDDGANDFWIIGGITEFPDNHVEIYNRWGELLYSADGYNNMSVRWDGKYKGKQLPVGTYYYIIDLKDKLYPDVFTGPITILR